MIALMISGGLLEASLQYYDSISVCICLKSEISNKNSDVVVLFSHGALSGHYLST